ncbi:aminoglycoside phosphotransferase [Mycolicibacterium conceptionense]|uniref:Aminoglycoside phosphotransferase n=2 Tax=Mycolicibacterium TaxID=1866885 RepID=A0ABR5FYS2_9MYCO|nr:MULTISPECIES: aminoglycoside phosphotransferase family protein [Mycolicibacterium]KLI04714.1 aminoglycoside phosphotransferase [Mycolicibacterium senegalense]KLO53054.1 aminoglycoside phosphotransferase [Mycolicibacterium senegalense]KMV14613.1 aminoglycoside phosphotransferase [Mycolicibacterium conceptionense]
MQTRSGADITVHGAVVAKLHRPGTDPRALRVRLQAAGQISVLLSPLSAMPEAVDGRWMSRWPLAETLVAQPECVPWVAIGQLLAALHTEPVTRRLPAHGWPARLRRAVVLTRRHRADVVMRAAAGLPGEAWRPGSEHRPRTLVHGDFHLGQVGRHGGHWRLIDVDDLGLGDPAWDLARPAGFWAAGLIPDADWLSFLDAYRDAGGPALPAGDPWPVLEPFARAAVIHAAATDPDDELLVAACARMPQLEKNSRPKPCLR